jgi:hypothetical protein
LRVGVFRIALDAPAAQCPDLLDRADQSDRRDTLAAIAFAGKEAGDPPIRERWLGCQVRTLVVDAWKLLR